MRKDNRPWLLFGGQQSGKIFTFAGKPPVFYRQQELKAVDVAEVRNEAV